MQQTVVRLPWEVQREFAVWAENLRGNSTDAANTSLGVAASSELMPLGHISVRGKNGSPPGSGSGASYAGIHAAHLEYGERGRAGSPRRSPENRKAPNVDGHATPQPVTPLYSQYVQHNPATPLGPSGTAGHLHSGARFASPSLALIRAAAAPFQHADVNAKTMYGAGGTLTSTPTALETIRRSAAAVLAALPNSPTASPAVQQWKAAHANNGRSGGATHQSFLGRVDEATNRPDSKVGTGVSASNSLAEELVRRPLSGPCPLAQFNLNFSKPFH